jgi:type-F conjugative transfer system pilin assembly protein TrbC
MKKNKRKNPIKRQNMKSDLKPRLIERSNIRAKIGVTIKIVIILIVAIILTFFLIIINKLSASENEQVKAGKEILSAIQNNQNQNHDIKAKDFQRQLDNDIANWSRNLENKLNEDVKSIRPIIGPEFKITKENQEFTDALIEKSRGIINESLGVSEYPKNNDQLSTDFLIFASFSIGEKNLENLIKLASDYNGAVILRGFKNGDFKETAAFLSKFSHEKEGILIDPNLFLEYQVTKVPTFVLTKPCDQGLEANCQTVFDKLTGMVSPRYALEKFSGSGELAIEAKERLG